MKPERTGETMPETEQSPERFRSLTRPAAIDGDVDPVGTQSDTAQLSSLYRTVATHARPPCVSSRRRICGFQRGSSNSGSSPAGQAAAAMNDARPEFLSRRCLVRPPRIASRRSPLLFVCPSRRPCLLESWTRKSRIYYIIYI
jgi:hypothetical protein